MQIVSNIALITINETLIVQLISFLLFLFILNRVMFRPLHKVIAERNAYIESLQQEIAGQQEELQNISKQIKKKEQKLLGEAHEMSMKHQDAGNIEAAEIIAATRREVAALKEKTTNDINQRIMELNIQLKDESEELVLRVMEKILDRRVAS
jgi:F-type H+-transporting ATPase subunit b